VAYLLGRQAAGEQAGRGEGRQAGSQQRSQIPSSSSSHMLKGVSMLMSIDPAKKDPLEVANTALQPGTRKRSGAQINRKKEFYI
jgi:hypothetical protein